MENLPEMHEYYAANIELVSTDLANKLRQDFQRANELLDMGQAARAEYNRVRMIATQATDPMPQADWR